MSPGVKLAVALVSGDVRFVPVFWSQFPSRGVESMTDRQVDYGRWTKSADWRRGGDAGVCG